MVAHALHYRETHSLIGVLESLAGLPFDVRFLSFDDIRSGVPEGVDVLVNVGSAGTAFSGGDAWLDPRVQSVVRGFVADGGGFVGVGEPTAAPANGAIFQLSDVLGVEQENGWSLSSTRHPSEHPDHFVTADLTMPFDDGDGASDVYACGGSAVVLRLADEQVQVAVNEFGAGRAVYLSGLPYTPQNSRLLHRALYWVAGAEERVADLGWAADPRVEVAWYPEVSRAFVTNASLDRVATRVTTPLGAFEVDLPSGGSRWFGAN